MALAETEQDTRVNEIVTRVTIGVDGKNMRSIFKQEDENGPQELLYWEVTIHNHIFADTVNFFLPDGVNGRKIDNVALHHVGETETDKAQHSLSFNIYPNKDDDKSGETKPERIDILAKLILRL